jgi:hypothetical protein
MNCDQVFDILTRGPFPTGGASDADVETHLSHCDECRRLADALRPALELFQEAVGPEESRDLPGYWCAVATDRTQPIVSFAASRQLRQTKFGAGLTKHWFATGTAVTAWRMAAMLALGATLGTVIGSRSALDSRLIGLPPVDSVAAAVGAADDDDGPQLTASQHSELAVIPAACLRYRPGKSPRFTLRGDQLLAQADLTNLICCSECHNINGEGVPKSATAQVAKQCQLCHSER